MGKRLFWIFVLVVVGLTSIAVAYFQSESFASLAKVRLRAVVERDLGVDLSFDRLRIGILPPSLSMLNVELKVLHQSNRLGLATDTVFKAERLGFSFRMIQAFSRGLAINKIFVSQGEVKLLLPKAKAGGPKEKLSDIVHRPIRMPLGDGFVADIRQIEIRNMAVDLSWREGGDLNQVKVGAVSYLALTPASRGTSIVANLEDVSILTPKVREQLKVVKANVEARRDSIALISLDVQRRAAAGHATGALTGSIDGLLEMKPSVKLILRAPLAELADFDQNLSGYGGDFLANLSLEGRLGDPFLKGSAEVTGFARGLWAIDKISGAGSYSAGKITLDSLQAEQGGGRVAITRPLQVNLPFREEGFDFGLRFTAFRFEKFAGELRRTVNNLQAEIDGVVNGRLQFSPGLEKKKLVGITAEGDLKLSSLELNNQVYGKKRPYSRIFGLQPFGAQVSVAWRNDELRIQSGRLVFPSGPLAQRGSVSGSKGFDLRAEGETVDFSKEVGEIAGIPVAGAGGLKVHVHGPADDVIMDFDLRVKGARYLKFDFGEVAGRVSYHDNRRRILITGLSGRRPNGAYIVNGSVDVGDKEDLALEAKFSESDPNELFAIFKEQLKDITWIPHGMTGTVEGVARVGGLYTDGLYTLSINGDIKGKSLSYRGEVVHDADLQVSLADGVLMAKILRARKYEMPFSGEIEYKLRTDEMKYWIAANRGKLRSLDFLTATGFPVDGIFDFRSEGRGKWETLESSTKMEINNVFVRTNPVPPVQLSLLTFADRSELSVNMGPALGLKVRNSTQARGESSAQLRADGINLDFLLCAISRRNCSDQNVSLWLKGAADFNWRGPDWRALSGGGTIQELGLARAGFQLRNEAPIAITATNGTMEASGIQLKGEQSRLGIRLRGKVDGSAIDNRIDGAASMQLLEFITPVVEEAKGQMAIAVGISGSLQNALFQGGIDIANGFLRITGLDAPVDNLAGSIKLTGSRVSLENLKGQLGGGTVQGTGGVDLFLNRPPKFGVELFVADNRLKFFPVNFVEVSEGRLTLTGDGPPYLFGGTVRMKRVMMRNNFDMAGGQKGPQHARYLPESARGSSSFYEIRIRAVADGGVMVENNLLDAEFKGEVTLLNNFEFPQIVARAELVRGKLLFRNNTFTLDHAYIRAPTPEYFNPQFSVGGTANVDNYRISIFADGTVDRPKITLTSYPALPQEDIVSLLAFGYRGEDAKRLNPDSANAITYSEVGSILLEQLKLSQNLQSKGVRMMVAPALTETELNILRPETNTQAAPKVYLQTQILKNLDASIGSTVGTAQAQSRDARLEYRIGRKASVSAVYEQRPTGIDAARSDDAYRNSYGADLKFRWGFR